MANTGWGCRPASDDGGDPLHAVCVQNGDILHQLTCSLPTAYTLEAASGMRASAALTDAHALQSGRIMGSPFRRWLIKESLTAFMLLVFQTA